MPPHSKSSGLNFKNRWRLSEHYEEVYLDYLVELQNQSKK